MKLETARKAAHWWAQFLESPVMPDNGDRSGNGVMTSGLASILQDAERSKLPPNAAQKFEGALSDLLIDKDGWNCFGVDYSPDRILQQAAVNAGFALGMTVLPWKTTMWIEGDKVTVRAGYGAEIEEITDKR